MRPQRKLQHPGALAGGAAALVLVAIVVVQLVRSGGERQAAAPTPEGTPAASAPSVAERTGTPEGTAPSASPSATPQNAAPVTSRAAPPQGAAPATSQAAPPAAERPPPTVATPAAPVAPPAPAPAPLPTLALAPVTTALSGVPCAALAPAVQGHEVRVQGFLPRSYGQDRLKNLLSSIPGASSVNLAVQEVGQDKCALLAALGPYWTAHRMAGGGGAIRLSRPGERSELAMGEPLVVDIAAPAYQSYVTVDYFQLDGHVVHLLPNLRARDNRLAPGQASTIGKGGDWLIGPPFGNEMLVLVATPVPLFDGLRPESEAGADYLRELQQQLARISRAQGPSKVAVDFLQISTRRKR